MAKLSGHTILVSGAAGGVGGAAALALGAEGAALVLLDKDIKGMERVYDQILAVGAPEPAMYPFDLAGATQSQYWEMSQTIASRYGSLQGLLHGAAELGVLGPMASQPLENWGHTLNVNLHGAFLLTQALLPVMQKSVHASIVFLTDSALKAGRAYTGAYGVSKLALEGMAKTWSEELQAAGKVRINTLSPGPLDTPMRARAYPAEERGVWPKPSALAELFVYLFADDSVGVTGQTLTHPFNPPF